MRRSCRDRAKHALREFGTWLILASFVLALAVAGITIWAAIVYAALQILTGAGWLP